MTTDRWAEVQEHAANMKESTTAFINRAIDETMSRDDRHQFDDGLRNAAIDEIINRDNQKQE